MNNKELVKHLILSGETAILLYGNSGTGKSTIARQVCQELDLPYTQAQCSANTDESTIIGTFVPNTKDKKSDFLLIKRALTDAFENGKVCIIDELNLAQPDTLSLLNSMLDDVAMLTLDDGTIIYRHKDFKLICTENTGLEGCKYMNAATMNRFYTINVEPLTHREIYERLYNNKLVEKNALTPELNTDLTNLYNTFINEGLDAGNIITYRNYKKIYSILNYISEKDKNNLTLPVVEKIVRNNLLDVFIENQDDITLMKDDSFVRIYYNICSQIYNYYISNDSIIVYLTDDEIIELAEEALEATASYTDETKRIDKIHSIIDEKVVTSVLTSEDKEKLKAKIGEMLRDLKQDEIDTTDKIVEDKKDEPTDEHTKDTDESKESKEVKDDTIATKTDTSASSEDIEVSVETVLREL